MYQLELQVMGKLKQAVISKLILMVVSGLFFSGCKEKLPVINYFIPQNFEGNVAIIYGNADTCEQNVYNFIIPEDGLVRVPYVFCKGDYLQNYYQRNEKNKWDTLHVELPSTQIDTTKNRIYFNRILTFEKNGSDHTNIVETFYVGKKRGPELSSDRFFYEKKLEEIVLRTDKTSQ
jgi:hypothetical protein